MAPHEGNKKNETFYLLDSTRLHILRTRMSEKDAGRHWQTAGERRDVSVPGAHFWDLFTIHKGEGRPPPWAGRRGW